MSGVILIFLSVSGLGSLVRFVPYPVTTGFTAGIGIVIAALQLPDLLGLERMTGFAHFHEKIGHVFSHLLAFQWFEAVTGIVTLLTFIVWSRFKIAIPTHLVALFIGTFFSLMLENIFPPIKIATIATRFHYEMQGVTGNGIPPFLPEWVWPWALPNAAGQPIGFSFDLFRALLPPALGIAILGAIQSLLCAVVADGMTGKKHHSNGELLGQGLGNVIAPFFGGIVATAAIARTSTNVRTGAQSPISAMIHAIVVLFAIVFLSTVLSYIPMSALAAVLIMGAYNMADFKHFLHILKVAPKSDVVVLMVCFILTVMFDMVLAVAVGLVLASLLFIKRMSELTQVMNVTNNAHSHDHFLPDFVQLYDVNGALFFGAAELALENIYLVNPKLKLVILDIYDVPHIDMTGIVALDSLANKLRTQKIGLVLLGAGSGIVKAMFKAGFAAREGIYFANDWSFVQTIILRYAHQAERQ